MCDHQIGFVRTSSCNYEDWTEIEGYGLNCHQWKCPDCSKVLLNQLRDRINKGLESDNNFYFFTLTTSFREMDIKPCWKRFRHKLNYSYPIDRYVWIMELTPPSHLYTDWKGFTKRSVGGLRHFHGLISFKDEIPTKDEIKDFWYKSTLGKSWQIHFEELINLRSPAGYLSKYLTKALSNGFHNNEKRIGFSKGFPRIKSNLESKTGVYMPYDPRHPAEEHDDFTKMLNELNKKYVSGQNSNKIYL